MSDVAFEISEGHEVDYDSEFHTVDAVWLSYPNGNRIDILPCMAPCDVEQLRLSKMREYEERCAIEWDRIQAMREDAAEARMERRREIAREYQREALEAAERQRGVKI